MLYLVRDQRQLAVIQPFMINKHFFLNREGLQIKRVTTREGGPEKLVGGFSYSLTIVLLIIIRSFALCTEVASSSGSRHCTICTVIWYGEKKNNESRLFFRSL